jgi:hypothetical protein
VQGRRAAGRYSAAGRLAGAADRRLCIGVVVDGDTCSNGGWTFERQPGNVRGGAVQPVTISSSQARGSNRVAAAPPRRRRADSAHHSAQSRCGQGWPWCSWRCQSHSCSSSRKERSASNGPAADERGVQRSRRLALEQPHQTHRCIHADVGLCCGDDRRDLELERKVLQV